MHCRCFPAPAPRSAVAHSDAHDLHVQSTAETFEISKDTRMTLAYKDKGEASD